jgi:hypothetical protein
MNATAIFLGPTASSEASQVQPLPDASEAAWDRWVFKVCGTGFVSWRTSGLETGVPSSERQLRGCVADD